MRRRTAAPGVATQTEMQGCVGSAYVYRQILPPYDAPMSFKLGVCGATVSYPYSSPNPAGKAQ